MNDKPEKDKGLRQWEKPRLTVLACNRTETGQFNYPEEGGWWVFNWGPPTS